MKRFWQYVDKRGDDECWQWTGPISKKEQGYGRVQIEGRVWVAHRLSVIIDGREIPDGMLVCHSCDNPGCVNPNHLWIGTPQENMTDKMRKGRGNVIGTENTEAKLCEEDIPRVRDMIRCGADFRDIADWFGVTSPTISKIATGRTWRHVH